MIDSKKLYQTIGDNLRRARKEMGMSQKDLANNLAFSNTTISKIENGSRKLGLDELSRFSDVLNKPIDYFVGNAFNTEQPDEAILQIRRVERLLIPIWDNIGLNTERKIVSYSFFDPELLKGRNVMGLRFSGEPLDDSIRKGDALFFDTNAEPKENTLVLAMMNEIPVIMRCIQVNGEMKLQYAHGTLPLNMVDVKGMIIESRRLYI
jgi:transcriptional regulator with XRE-family HTH domain